MAGTSRTSTNAFNDAADARRFLSSLPKTRLVELLSDHAMFCDRLFEALQLEAVCTQTAPDVSGFRKMIDRVIRRDTFVSYRESFDLSRRIDDLVDRLGTRLEDGRGEDVMTLTEHLLRRCEHVLGNMDDSAGTMKPVMERATALHVAACRSVRPDPIELALRLFTWEMTTEWDTFSHAVRMHADVLGDTGIAEYRRLAEDVWREYGTLAPGDRCEFDPRRFRCTCVMEDLARLTGDVDALVTVLGHDLSSAYRFQRIATELRGSGRLDEAILWAERGLRAFPDRRDDRLVSLTIELYHQAGRQPHAMDLARATFETNPNQATYRQLRAVVLSRQWPEERARAIAHLRSTLRPVSKTDAGTDAGQPFGCHRADGSTLVAILLSEECAEDAWQAARDYGCSETLWTQLAHLREDEHPLDAAAVYEHLIEHFIGHKDKRGYRSATDLLVRVKALLARGGRPEHFRNLLQATIDKHRRKRNLMKLITASFGEIA
ncbi:MAG: hypothetical protein HKN07_08160 [Acidimicrobiia bacterium]|nr:hypothetical protein [Acidimicrobiia bacterium]